MDIKFTSKLLLASLQIGVDLGLGRRITVSKLRNWSSNVNSRQIKAIKFYIAEKI